MNKIIRLLVAMMLLALTSKSFAQLPVQTKLTEINIHNVETIEERVFLLHSIQESEFFFYRLSNEEGKIDIYISDNYTCEDSNANADFDAFMENLEEVWMAHCNLDKTERGRLFVEWRYQLDDPVFFMINEDFHRQLRNRDNSTCDGADPFCTDNGLYQFPAGVNAGNLGSSTPPYYCSSFVRPNGSSTNCLYTTPNPAFYYMQIDQPGNLNIYMYSTPSHDIDFDCWGPFTDINTACSQLSCSNMVDCSYSASATENCYINNAQTGQYYILLITNYSNATCNISFSNIGTGTTNCGILPPLVGNDGPYCVGETINLTAHGQAGATYNWSGPGGFSSNQQNPTRPNCTMNMAGTYTCTISVGSATNSATTDVVIYPQPTANFNFTTVCLGNPTQFSSTSTTNPSGQQISSFLWNFGDGQTSTLQDPSHTYTNAGTYQVTLTVSCGNGLCTSTKTQSVTVYAEPAANAGPDQTIPYNTSTQLNGSGGAGTFNFHWEPANMVVNPNAQNTQTVTLTHDQTYTLTVTNPQGNCSNTDQVTIHIEGGALTVSANASPASICNGSSTQLTASAGGGMGNCTYSWTPTTGLSNPNIYNPVATPTQTTTYTCTVNNPQTNQSATATVTVVVHNAGYSEETHYICPGDLYEWHGQNYSDEGDYEFPTTTQYGCDSVITLHLHHYPTYDETLIEEAICSDESYNFFGTVFTSPVQTSHTLQTIHGCDSIVRLNLTVYPDNGITDHPVTVCPSQLPFYYEEDPNQIPLYAGDHLFHLQDIHGCDSVVVVQLTVSEYYIPPVQTEYVCYVDEPSFTWNVNGRTYHTEGLFADTIPYSDCEGIFSLDLHFQQVPEKIVEEMITCDSYTWPWTGQTYTESGEYYHHVSLEPFPCQQEYELKLTINTQSLLPDKYITDSCDFAQIHWFGQDTTFTANTVYTFRGQTDEGCYREQTYHIENMHYTPNPNTIKCSDGSVIMFGLPEDPNAPVHDTAMCAAVVTNTEFFSFQYTFYIEETNRECVWESCNWSISKPSWAIEFNPVPTVSLNGKYYSECTVYVADRQDDYVVLTATINNGCGSKERKFYLKSSFLDVDENQNFPAKVNIVPNPNNGQMHLDFENMEGKTSIKVFDMTGNQIDAFETNINSNRYNYDYNMKRYAEGIYFFVVSNNNRIFTKKVVIIR